MGQKSTSLDLNKPIVITIGPELLHSMLAVSYAQTPETLLISPVAGFVYITHINMDEKKVTLLTPSISELPSNLLILGTIKWQDTT